jgi:molybdopterin molybdotransferase
LISFEDALAAVLAEARVLGEETLAVGEALGRYLAADLVAVHESPGFDNSAVDGYAVIAADLAGASPSNAVELHVVGTVYAGDATAELELRHGECVRTMTGAQVVRGADAVVMQEDVVTAGTAIRGRLRGEGAPERAVFSAAAASGQAVRRRGEEFRTGDLLVARGTKCTPSVLSLVAGQGFAEATVGRVPRVGVIVTGTELAKPGVELAPGQIYESNSVALAAAVRSLTGFDSVVKSVGDDAAATREAFESLVGDCDVVVFSGGASVGEKDLVRAVLLGSGVEERFWRINMKPGKPVFFGVHHGGALVFALPGNPVSAQVTFELLVASAILKMSGSSDHSPRFERATLGGCIKRVPGRKEFVRAVTRVEGGRLLADPLAKQGSHMSSGIALADRLVVVEQDAACVEAGTLVETVPLRWRATP